MRVHDAPSKKTIGGKENDRRTHYSMETPIERVEMWCTKGGFNFQWYAHHAGLLEDDLRCYLKRAMTLQKAKDMRDSEVDTGSASYVLPYERRKLFDRGGHCRDRAMRIIDGFIRECILRDGYASVAYFHEKLFYEPKLYLSSSFGDVSEEDAHYFLNCIGSFPELEEIFLHVETYSEDPDDLSLDKLPEDKRLTIRGVDEGGHEVSRLVIGEEPLLSDKEEDRRRHILCHTIRVPRRNMPAEFRLLPNVSFKHSHIEFTSPAPRRSHRMATRASASKTAAKHPRPDTTKKIDAIILHVYLE